MDSNYFELEKIQEIKLSDFFFSPSLNVSECSLNVSMVVDTSINAASIFP